MLGPTVARAPCPRGAGRLVAGKARLLPPLTLVPTRERRRRMANAQLLPAPPSLALPAPEGPAGSSRAKPVSSLP
jgi:hypothetical protein